MGSFLPTGLEGWQSLQDMVWYLYIGDLCGIQSQDGIIFAPGLAGWQSLQDMVWYLYM
jgi:hypothetical protein